MDITEIPDDTSGEWKVEEFKVSKNEASLFNLRMAFQPGMGRRTIKPGRYKRLVRGNITVMSNTPAEISDHWEPIHYAKGKVLLNGLGLGVVLAEILKKPEVKSVTVIEHSPDVIKLIGPHFSKDPRVEIIQADALEWKPPKNIKYDIVWHDIWDAISADNLPTMHKLHRKYGRKTKWQGSWCRYLCEMYR